MSGKLGHREQRAIAEIDRLYATLPVVPCRQQCGGACGPIPLTDLEARRLQTLTHVKPRTIPITRVDAPPREHCVYLDARGRCSAYRARPLICRVWGVVKMLSCPYGCVPTTWLSDIDFVRLAQAVERLGGGRVIRTAPEGLVYVEGENFAHLPTSGPGMRSPEAIAANSERTRNLRALFGGRIIIAVDERQA